MDIYAEINGEELDDQYDVWGQTWTHIESADEAGANTLELLGIFSLIGVDATSNANVDEVLGELRFRTSEFRTDLGTPNGRKLRKDDAVLSPVDATTGEQIRYRVSEVPQDDGFGELVFPVMKSVHTKAGMN